MTLSELLSGVDYKCKNYKNIQINNVTSNSKLVLKGDMFIAIDGVSVDGHNYIQSAIDNGASVIITEKSVKTSDDVIVIKTKNSRISYSRISANFYDNPARHLKFIGITGTNGKTSTAYLTYHILKTCGKKAGLIGTIENITGKGTYIAKYTTPDAMELQKLLREMVQTDIEYVVMEVSSHALSQDRVCDIVFEAAAFTNLTQDHLDYHHTMEKYKSEKLKLMQQCKKAVINIDDDAAQDFKDAVRGSVYTVGVQKDAYFKVENIKPSPDKMRYTITSIEGDCNASVAIPGMFSVYNSVIAIALARCIGISLKAATKALVLAKGVSGRMEPFETNRDFYIVLDYAHTPDSLEKALITLKQKDDARLVVVFGCGGDRDKEKRPIMGKIAVETADFVIITSDNPRTEKPSQIIEDIVAGIKETTTPYKIIEDRKKAIKYAVENAKPSDIILLAGKGHETYQILSTGKIHFDEREVLKELLRN